MEVLSAVGGLLFLLWVGLGFPGLVKWKPIQHFQLRNPPPPPPSKEEIYSKAADELVSILYMVAIQKGESECTSCGDVDPEVWLMNTEAAGQTIRTHFPRIVKEIESGTYGREK